MVTPAKGKSVFYTRIGPNLFKSGSATYEFSTIHNGVWRSNDKRSKVIQLRRVGWS